MSLKSRVMIIMQGVCVWNCLTHRFRLVAVSLHKDVLHELDAVES